MDTKLLVSTALVTPQGGGQTRSSTPVQNQPTAGRTAQAATVAPPESSSEAKPVQPVFTERNAQQAVLRQSAPNSALTTYRDQDSGRLIVRVYDRESGDVLVEFPPEKTFRPAVAPATATPAKARTSFSV
ncbi:flagellar protein FlaG [Pelagibius sp.]|uniref:flagellar protein FlaG n=1 Tax=Pelagibius sp. TaxID=1931238 RepID=UPI00260F943B|nr:flagellar protein FlaG [Pelagibius sp.]